MKAIMYEKYGPPEVLKLKETTLPTPNDDQMLIKVHATAVTPMGYRIRSGNRGRNAPLWPITRFMMGRKPSQTILEGEVSGEIVEAGKNITKFKKGDKIFGLALASYAEYTLCSEKSKIQIMPPNISFEEGASIAFGGLTSLYFLRTRGNIQSGQKVLIYGASGGVGVFAVQIAKLFGAEVTGVCSSKNFDLVRSLGADRVIDYKKEDFRKENNQHYDIIFDTVGKLSFGSCKKVLAKTATFLETVPSYRFLLRVVWSSIIGKRKVVIGVGGTMADLEYLKEQIESGKLKIVIDRTYSLEQAVEAHRYVEQGHKVGSVVLKVST